MREILLATPTGEALPENWMSPTNEALKMYDIYKSLGIVATSAAVLHKPAMVIPEDAIQSRDTLETVDRLFRVAEKQREMGRMLVGLAAQQIGIDARIFIADVQTSGNGTLGNLTAFINAEGIPFGRQVLDHEGCFSCPCVFARFKRQDNLNFTAWNPQGKIVHEIFERFSARVLSHEIDHTEGTLFADVALSQGVALNWHPPELRQDYFAAATAANEPGGEWNWKYTIPAEQWLAMKDGSFSLDNFRPSTTEGAILQVD